MASKRSRSRWLPVGDQLRYLVKLSRPRFWMYLAGPAIVGVVYAAETTAGVLSVPAIAIVCYFLLPANVYLYGINDVFDADIDETNPKKGDREVRYGGQPFVVAAVGLTGVGLVVLVPLVNDIALLYLGAYFLLATEYSAPPLRFKTTPGLDSLSNGLYVLPGAVTYAAVSGSHPPALALAGGWLWTMAMHTFSAIPDIEPDRAAGIETTATLLGEDRTYLYCGGCWLLSAVAFGLLDPRLGAVIGCYPVLLAGIALSGVEVDRAYWWFPTINTLVGMVITIGGLLVLVNG